MRSSLILALPLLAACATPSGVPRSVTINEPGQLLWADEFDGQELDPTIWSHDMHRNSRGWYNDELQYYGPDNAVVADGLLRITARREDSSDKPGSNGQLYTSSRIHTKGLRPIQYGRVEARIKVPCGRGLWPAFWMLSEDGDDWPRGGEIDIMEYVGHQPKTFHATVHTAAYNHVDGTEVGRKIDVADACDAFHIHRLDWSEDAITVSLDGDPYFTFERAGRSEAQWPFDKPFHLLLNVAVGGSWGGQKGVDDTVFPAVMEVDWVRVYDVSG